MEAPAPKPDLPVPERVLPSIPSDPDPSSPEPSPPEPSQQGAPSPAPAASLVRLWSGDFFGLDGRPVEVQVDVCARASPAFNIVGLPGKSTRESRERIRTAVRNSGFEFPADQRIIVNLAPAFQEKEGAVFDLPVALGILLATRQAHPRGVSHGAGPAAGGIDLSRFGFIGELGLEGELRPVPGALLVASALRERGVQALVAPAGNADEVALLPDILVYAAEDLHQALLALGGRLRPHRRRAGPEAAARLALDLADVRGQEGTKRALLIAGAGGHNVLIAGPPGVGKTMLAQRLPGILPPLLFEESVEVTRIRSAAGLCVRGGLVRERPFRAPHHTISYSGLVGGGSPPRPGEVSLAHRGILFLDELPEFPRKALEALRQPLEDGRLTIARSSGSVSFPASFLLVAAMNPCPCGYLGHPRRPCRCTPLQVQAYRQRLSGPLLDRIDLYLTVGPVDSRDLLAGAGDDAVRSSRRAAGRADRGARRTEARPSLSTADLVPAVVRARERQSRRWGGPVLNGPVLNGRAGLDRLLGQGEISADVLRRLAALAEARGLSVRAFERTLRVARTIADLEDSAGVVERHLDEALSYRES